MALPPRSAPATPAAPVPQAVEDASGPVDPVPPTPEPTEPESSSSEHHDKAVALLVGLRRTDDRFTLSSPARFLAHRLWELLAPPLVLSPMGPGVSEASAPDPGPPRPLPMVDCEGGCNRAFRAPEPGAWCRDCRAARDRRPAEAAGAESADAA